jgi:hypothetical protein
MPKTKTTDMRNNVYKGIRKLSKINSIKTQNTQITTTEEMLDILNSVNDVHMGENNVHNGDYKIAPKEFNYENQSKHDIDPFFVTDVAQTDTNGKIIKTNRIASLLGGIAQINSGLEYIPPMDLNDTINNFSNNMPLGVEELTTRITISPSMPQHNMMPQQMNYMMPEMMNHMMPQQMNHIMPQQMNHMMPEMMNMKQEHMMPQKMNTSFIKNIAALNNISRIA